MTRHYDDNLPLLNLKGMLQYSKSENMVSSKTVVVTNRITDIVIDNYRGVKDIYYPLPNCQPYKGKSVLRYKSGTSWAGTPAGVTVLTIGAIAATTGVITAIMLTGRH